MRAILGIGGLCGVGNSTVEDKMTASRHPNVRIVLESDVAGSPSVDDGSNGVQSRASVAPAWAFCRVPGLKAGASTSGKIIKKSFDFSF